MIKEINNQLVLCDEIPLKEGQTLNDLLELSIRLGVLINTHGIRGIGKTTALIKIAKKHNLPIVVATKILSNNIYNYDKIYTVNDKNLRNYSSVLVDELVDINKLIENVECKIIGGFYYNKNTNIKETKLTKNKTYSKQDMVKTLIKEAEMLDKARMNTLNLGKYSDYKLLINNYKQVLNLIHEIVYEETPNPINVTFNIDNFDKENMNKIFNEINKMNKINNLEF